MKLPKARTENIVEQNLGKETLIYDLLIDKAFNLNETLTVVYKACNGKTTFDELKGKHKFTDDFIYLALDELKQNDLLADESYVSPFAKINRREVIKKVGLASMFVLPVISGLVAPRAVDAASGASADPFGAGAPGNVCRSDPQNQCDGADFNGLSRPGSCLRGTCCGLGATRSPGESFSYTGPSNTYSLDPPSDSTYQTFVLECCSYSATISTEYSNVQTLEGADGTPIYSYDYTQTATCDSF